MRPADKSDIRTSSDSVNDSRLSSTMKSSVLLGLFMSLFLDLVGFTVILPLLPQLLNYYGVSGKDPLYDLLQSSVRGFRNLVGAPDTPKWNSVLLGGLIGSLFSLLQFAASPLIGAASDRYGRKPMLLLTMVGISASYVVWAFSKNFTTFVIARVIGGLSKGNISLSTAIVADVSKPEERGKGMAVVGIAFSLGFMVGPMVGALSSRIPISSYYHMEFYVGPALFALALAVMDIFYIYFLFPETLPVEKRSASIAGSVRQASALINPISLFRFSAMVGSSDEDRRNMQRIGAVYFLYLFLYSGLEFTLTFLTFLRFDYDSMQQGRMFLFIGILMIVVQGGYVRRIPAGKEKGAAIKGLLLLIPSFVIVGLSKSTVWLYVGLALYSTASASVVPCLTTLIASYGTLSQKGTVMGIFRSLGSLARALGPVIASFGYWSFGPEVSYVIGGILLLAPLYCLYRVAAPKVRGD